MTASWSKREGGLLQHFMFHVFKKEIWRARRHVLIMNGEHYGSVVPFCSFICVWNNLYLNFCQRLKHMKHSVLTFLIIFVCSLIASRGTLVAPICCVIPPASPSCTCVWRSWDKMADWDSNFKMQKEAKAIRKQQLVNRTAHVCYGFC